MLQIVIEFEESVIWKIYTFCEWKLEKTLREEVDIKQVDFHQETKFQERSFKILSETRG